MQFFVKLIEEGFRELLFNTFVYLVLTLPFFIIFWRVWEHRSQHRRIQLKKRSNTTMLKYELKYSIITLLIFSLIDILLFVAQTNHKTKLYVKISDYGWLYFWFSILVMLVLHDAWFYFSHRIMHHPKIFKYIHRVHHQSVDPSPFAAFSFHPIEAFIEATIYIIFAFLFPVNIWALCLWQIIQMLFNVIGHLGYEIYPKSFNTHWIFKWKTPSTHHNMHHSNFSGNYGLYFTWWDKIFKTEFKNYNEVYDNLQIRISKKRNKISSFTD